MEMEILLLKNIFFPDFTERPQEAPVWSLKKIFFNKRLKCTAGNSSLKIFLKLDTILK
jgi:hypothetical protein